MNVLIRVMLALVSLLLPLLGLASELSTQRGAPIAEFLDAQGRLDLPEGYTGSLDPKGFRMVTDAGQAPKFVADSGVVPNGGTGGQWTGFGGIRDGCNGSIAAIARMTDGNFVVGGAFSLCNEAVANNIAIYSPSSNTWSGLGTGIGDGVNVSYVSALAVSGSDLYVGGFFTQAGGLSANRLARWNGSVWSSLGTGSGNGVSGGDFPQVSALAVSGSDLYVGGEFTQAGGLPANYVARWNGSVWSSLGTGSGNGVNNTNQGTRVSALAVSGSDLYVGGEFTQAGGLPANNVARWNGSVWSSLGMGIGNGVGVGIFNTGVYALVVSGSDLYVGGRFGTAGGQVSSNIAKWGPTAEMIFASGFEGN